MKRTFFVTTGIAAAMIAVPALAHHSHAMFDFTKKVALEGTVKEFKWTNPHSWLHVMAANERGEIVEFAFEMGAPTGLLSRGWRPNTVAPGDKVTVSFYPTKTGSPGGSLTGIKLPDGTIMGEQYD